MTTKNFGTRGALSQADLSTLRTAELVTLYNEMGPARAIKSFHDKATAVERVWALGTEPPAQEAPVTPVKPKKAPKADPVSVTADTASAPESKSPGRPPITHEVLEAPAGVDRKLPRPGTKVDIAVNLWSRPGGATAEEVMVATNTSRGQLRGILRWMNEGMGWSFRTVEGRTEALA